MPNKSIFLNICFLTCWVLACFLVADYRYELQFKQLVQQYETLAKANANGLAEDVDSHLSNLYGIPDFLSKTHRVRDAVTIPFDKQGNKLSNDEKKRIWLKNPKLLDLDNFLALAAKDFYLDHIFVLNAQGDCIGSSLWSTESSCIGINFSERAFFEKNKAAFKGMQYAMGKTTHVGGLFFSVPIMLNGEFFGSVVAKFNVNNLSSVFKLQNVLILDSNQVVIYSSIPNTQLKTLSANLESSLSPMQIKNIYQTDKIPLIMIDRWSERSSDSLVRVNRISRNYPFLLENKQMEKWNLRLVILQPLEEVSALSKSKNYFFMMLSILGGALILVFRIANELTSK